MSIIGIVLSLVINGIDKITPSLREIMAKTPPGEKIKILVYLSEKPDYERIKNLKPKEYVEFLKSFSENSQKDIINYLRKNFNDKISDLTPYFIFNGFYLKAEKEVIEALSERKDVEYIIEDFIIKIEEFKAPEGIGILTAPTWNIKKVRAESCWMAGFTGEGVIIGHLDTGVDISHPALSGKWLGHPYWFDIVNHQPIPYDDHGHGTITMGTILGGDGNGPFHPDIGIAPGAKFVATKCFDHFGSGTASWIHACFQKILEWKGEGVNIVAVSNSWGVTISTSLAFWQDCLNWRNVNIIPIFAIGNEGPDPNTTLPPGNYPIVIGVGATDANDNVASFSSRGPAPNQAPWNNPEYWPRPDWNLIKPDISAPGVLVPSSIPGGYYGAYSGTSMACPHVTGAIAILFQKNPTLTFREVYNLLLGYARCVPQGAPYPNNNYGWGILNVYQSLLHTPLPPPESLIVFTPFNFAKLHTKNPVFKMRAVDPQGDDVIYGIYFALDTLFTSPESILTFPYPSGQIATYILPVSLSHGETYWFKVKVRDTNSLGGWSQFTPKFSLTIDTSMLINTCSWYQTKGAQFKYNSFYGTKIQGDSVVLKPYGIYIDTLLFENFEAGIIPFGWSVIDGNNDGVKWICGITEGLGGYTPPNYETRYAFYDDNDAGNNVINYNEELLTPKIGIPQNVTNLTFRYSYGFRVHQAGEKFRIHFRKKTGSSWTAWHELKAYTVSSSGTDSFNLISQLPCDSIQFRFFYSDSTAPSHWGLACAIDNVLLKYSYQINEGTMRTAPCFYKELSRTYPRTNWGYIHWEKSSQQDSIGIQVEYFDGNYWQLIPDASLPGNSQGFFTNNKVGHLSIINLDTITYNTIRVKTIFVRKQNAQNPALLWIEIGNPAIFLEEFTKTLLKPQISVYPHIFKDKLYIKYLLPPFEKAKIKIYSIPGRKLKEISFNLNENQVSGTYIFEEKIPQGIYFIKLETQNYKKTLKVIHIK